METIASFKINHDVLERGIYISRIDRDVVTYDLRMKVPNKGDYLSNGAMHTIEHIVATFARNGQHSDNVIYVGPMGCRTGFYLLVRDAVSRIEVIDLVKDAFSFVAEFEGEIPGAKQRECGNYLEHDLCTAKREASEFLKVIESWTPENMKYKE